MKYVYVVISHNTDLYLKQSAISIMSFLYHQENAEIILITDHETVMHNAKHMDFFINRGVIIKEVDIPEIYRKKGSAVISRFIKTNLYEYIDDDFLFIDSDTIICAPLNTNSEFSVKIGAVMNFHLFEDENPNKTVHDKNAAMLGFHTNWNNIHFNSGILYVHQCPETEAFFHLWHKLWIDGLEKDIYLDQTSFNEANYRTEGLITELDGIWNCQLWPYSKSLRYLYNAKILHYFSDDPEKIIIYDLSNSELEKWDWDSDNGKICEIIRSPKTAFSSVKGYIINSTAEKVIQQSIAYHGLRNYYRKHKKSFTKIDRFLWNYYLIFKKNI